MKENLIEGLRYFAEIHINHICIELLANLKIFLTRRYASNCTTWLHFEQVNHPSFFITFKILRILKDVKKLKQGRRHKVRTLSFLLAQANPTDLTFPTCLKRIIYKRAEDSQVSPLCAGKVFKISRAKCILRRRHYSFNLIFSLQNIF